MLAVIMIVQNESDRYLERALETAHRAIGDNGIIRITDDCSIDDTVEKIYQSSVRENDVQVLRTRTPLFWNHEGGARQRHWEWATSELSDGDWVLSLDADETLNKPERIQHYVKLADEAGAGWVGLPLYEFWTPTHHRTDGYWFGTTTGRLYKYKIGGKIRNLSMACGSEPEYVSRTSPLMQNEIHLLHWGYMREDDRIRKHKKYTEREGGHGHLDAHVQSIVERPTIKRYESWL